MPLKLSPRMKVRRNIPNKKNNWSRLFSNKITPTSDKAEVKKSPENPAMTTKSIHNNTLKLEEKTMCSERSKI